MEIKNPYDGIGGTTVLDPITGEVISRIEPTKDNPDGNRPIGVDDPAHPDYVASVNVPSGDSAVTSQVSHAKPETEIPSGTKPDTPAPKASKKAA